MSETWLNTCGLVLIVLATAYLFVVACQPLPAQDDDEQP